MELNCRLDVRNRTYRFALSNVANTKGHASNQTVGTIHPGKDFYLHTTLEVLPDQFTKTK